MKRNIPLILAMLMLGLLVVLVASNAVGDDNADATKLFKKSGCNECHGVLSHEITVKKKEKSDEEAAEDEDVDDDEDKPDPPDLSGVGLEHDAKWISNYLRKKEEIDGRKHEKLFKGSTQERRLIATWLADMKTKPEDLPKQEGESEKANEKSSGEETADEESSGEDS